MFVHNININQTKQVLPFCWSSVIMATFMKADIVTVYRSIQVRVNTMLWRKSTSIYLREPTVAAHPSQKCHDTISTLFGVHHFTVRKVCSQKKKYFRKDNFSKFSSKSNREMLQKVQKPQELGLRFYKSQL